MANLKSICVAAVAAVMLISPLARAESAWGPTAAAKGTSGFGAGLGSGWGHEHPLLVVGLKPRQVSLLDPDAMIDETAEAATQAPAILLATAAQATSAVAPSQPAKSPVDPAAKAVAATSEAIAKPEGALKLQGIAARQEERAWPGPPETAPPPAEPAPVEPASTAPTSVAVTSIAPTPAAPPVVQTESARSAGDSLGEPASLAPPRPVLAQAQTTAPTPSPTPPPMTAISAPGSIASGPAAPASAEGAYVLGPQDKIKVIVFQEPDLSGEFAVQSTGRVSLPLLGELQAQGLTVRELQASITAELKSRQLLNDPKVAVDVMNARPFYILGEVQKPGEYPYTSGLSVLNAVATAGGFTALADQTNVYIRRVGSANWTPYELAGGLQVGPGDTIRIEKGAFYILGEVQRAGEYAYTPGMSVMRAVAIAQGYTPRAERGRVLITRKGETVQRELPMRPDVAINPGDTIMIPERWF